MSISINRIASYNKKQHLLALVESSNAVGKLPISPKEKSYVQAAFKNGRTSVEIADISRIVIVALCPKNKNQHRWNEDLRMAGYQLMLAANSRKMEYAVISVESSNTNATYFVLEGAALGSYQFLKYFQDKKERVNCLKKLSALSDQISASNLSKLNNMVSGVSNARDLVNEPLSYLTATQLSAEIKKTGKKAGFKVEVFNKAKITALKMGGLLAVNLGSKNPPTFNVLEWKPKNAKNKKPIVLVGKGVVYDTGGLSLKPTANSMDKMKSDMGGAAAVIGTMEAISRDKLPLHVIALIPSTENRPGENAYAPGDVIKMHSGLTVEVLNTDAEGRMILADALSYAKKYDPELVVDFATLTGAAARAIGPQGVVYMGTAGDKVMASLSDSGYEEHERVVEFPLWDEYAPLLNSDIADMKNIGGPEAGAITAGKFLERFTSYPWVHVDIAGSAFIDSNNSYRGKNGTGVGVKLMTNYLRRRAGK